MTDEELELAQAEARATALRYYAAREHLNGARAALLESIWDLYENGRLSQESISAVLTLDEERSIHRSRIGQFLREVRHANHMNRMPPGRNQ